ncbi:inorganic phosphate transporter [Aquibacillus rhizosphaerae]|uniref:Phosphate transporter n=1 Tax=Aquibacillus rhizosphaerae TaxID=3051431 RepID=A0ABT7LEI4_9BACI|nr:inorganic phosphate transporter [Aquibacillus sp. LR5S19]MDL4843010.1 anion permease [Aquibacillus sp. LR5S19]
MITTLLACLIAFFFALNIGASGAAASMGIAYGSGAVKRKKVALLICGIGIFLGAILGGEEVVKTLGSEIVPKNIISINIALIILGSASVSLFLANLSGIPLSTSEVIVGAIVGVGIAFKVLFVNTLVIIVMYWLLVPLIAFILAFVSNKGIQKINKKFPFLNEGKWPKILVLLVIITGFLEAFSAGMNNVANAVGPLVAAGIISLDQGTFTGGFFVALGAIFLGGKVIETNGKKITNLSLLQGGTVSGIGASLVIIASLFGIPVPHTQVTTCSILDVGASELGREIWKKAIIAKLIKTWVISPLFSLVISYNLIKLFIDFDFSGIVLLFAFVVIVYLIGLWNPREITHPVYKERVGGSSQKL